LSGLLGHPHELGNFTPPLSEGVSPSGLSLGSLLVRTRIIGKYGFGDLVPKHALSLVVSSS
ncbi:MAG: hypothetical protein ACE5IR_25290, partial [bacterium]